MGLKGERTSHVATKVGSGGSSKSSSSPTDRMSSSFLIPLSCHHGQFSLARNANMTKVLRPACLLRVSRPKNSNYLYSSFVIQFSITTQSFHFMSRNFRQEVSRVPGSEYGGSCGREGRIHLRSFVVVAVFDCSVVRSGAVREGCARCKGRSTDAGARRGRPRS